jgi:hypothetical protein
VLGFRGGEVRGLSPFALLLKASWNRRFHTYVPFASKHTRYVNRLPGYTMGLLRGPSNSSRLRIVSAIVRGLVGGTTSRVLLLLRSLMTGSEEACFFLFLIPGFAFGGCMIDEQTVEGQIRKEVTRSNPNNLRSARTRKISQI